MTVQELYDWCKQNNLTDANIKICLDDSYFIDITKQDMLDSGNGIVLICVES